MSFFKCLINSGIVIGLFVGTALGEIVGSNDDNVANLTISSNPNRKAQKIVMPVNGTITQVVMFRDIADNGEEGSHLILAVYNDQNGKPGTRLAVSTNILIGYPRGWEYGVLATPLTVTANTPLWLAWIYEKYPGVYYKSGGPGAVWSYAGWTSGGDNMPSSFGNSTSESRLYSIYAVYTPEPSPPDPAGDSWVTDGDNGIKTLKNVGIVGPDWTHSGAEALLYLGDQNHTIRACYGPNGNNGGGLVFQTLGVGDHYFRWRNSNGNTLMLINGQSGKTAIGLESVSDYKLDVNGNTQVRGQLVANSVKIGDWTLETPDYVFNEAYKLRSLDEVEASIKANKHLPDVPSAAEMKKNGVDLSEMNMTLLKKIEELTLYVIEQNKKIESLEKKVNEK